VIERSVYVQQCLLALATNELKVRCKLFEVTWREREQKPIGGWM
jgi:hypothetical protein